MIGWVSAAFAQSGGFDAHGFRLVDSSADLRSPVQFQRPGAVSPRAWSTAILGEYASRPLLFELDGVESTPLQDLWVVNVAGGFAPLARLRVDLSAPIVLSSQGDTTRAGVAPGDVRASVLFAALTPDRTAGFGLGLSTAVDVPTGNPVRYLGTDGWAGQAALTTTFEWDRVILSALAGARLAPNSAPDTRPAPTRGGDTFEGAGHLGVVASDTTGFGLEAQVSVAFDPEVRDAIGIPATLLAYARTTLDGGSYLSGGLGVGLGNGAGASPIRLLIGGGFGAAGEGSGGHDGDLDGVVDRLDECPRGAENANGYRDDDGCPDELPEVVFEVVRDGAPAAETPVVATAPDGARVEGIGRVAMRALPGTVLEGTADAPSCYGGYVRIEVPSADRTVVRVPIERETGQLVINVADTAGRSLPAAEARYLLDDEACGADDPSLVAGAGVHTVGASSLTLFLTAPGYGVAQSVLTLKRGQREEISAKLAPTQVTLKQGQVRFGLPLRFGENSAQIEPEMAGLLGQLATVILTERDTAFEIDGFGEGALARDRAEAVVTWLVAAGVPASRVAAAAKGPRPLDQRDDIRVVPL